MFKSVNKFLKDENLTLTVLYLSRRGFFMHMIVIIIVIVRHCNYLKTL